MGEMGGLLEYAITPLRVSGSPTWFSLWESRYGRRGNGLIAGNGSRAVSIPYCSTVRIWPMLTPKTDAAICKVVALTFVSPLTRLYAVL